MKQQPEQAVSGTRGNQSSRRRQVYGDAKGDCRPDGSLFELLGSCLVRVDDLSRDVEEVDCVVRRCYFHAILDAWKSVRSWHCSFSLLVTPSPSFFDRSRH